MTSNRIKLVEICLFVIICFNTISVLDNSAVFISSKDIKANNYSGSAQFSRQEDPSSKIMNLVARYQEGQNRIEDICTYGSFLIIADIYDSIKVIDVSDLSNLVKVFHGWPGGKWHAVEIQGDYLYTAHHGDGMQIYDITDPTNLLKYGILWMNPEQPYTDPQDVAVEGNYAYLADDFKGLQVIDVSDISNPVEIGRFNDTGDTKGVAVSGSYAYIIERGGVFEVIDITNKTNPEKVGNLDGLGTPNNLVVQGNISYVADLEDGLEIYDISSPANPSLLTTYNDGISEANGIAINGTVAYLADGSDGLELIDISNPLNPILLEKYSSNSNATNVHINGSRIYLAQEGGTVDILDVDEETVPYSPVDPPKPIIQNNRIQVDPYVIRSNNDFLKYNFPGAGTKDDPYLIENRFIQNDRESLIEIVGTTKHFIIRNCLLDGKNINFGGTGIILDGVTNAYIVNNTIYHTSQGIVCVSSSYNVISGNQVIFNGAQGILLHKSIRNLISDNEIYAQSYETSSSSQDYGIGIYESDSNEIFFNSISKFRLYGLLIDSSSFNNSIQSNNFQDNYLTSSSQAMDEGSMTVFINNYWNEWNSPDNNSDGIVDISYPINGGKSFDHSPRSNPIHHTLTSPILSFVKDYAGIYGTTEIFWTPIEDSIDTQIEYCLYFSNDTIDWYLIANHLENNSYFWDTSILNFDTSYWLRVVGRCGTGLSTYGISFTSFDTISNPPNLTSNLNLFILISILIMLGINRKRRKIRTF